MPDPQDRSPIRRIFEEGFNAGDLTAVDELLSPDHLAHSAFGGAPNGPQGLKWLILQFRGAFPDLHCIVKDEIRVGEKAAAHFTMQGTQLGPFLGSPPTGRPIVAQGLIFARTENDRIVEDWLLIDSVGILQQLGVVPPPRTVSIHFQDR